MSNLFPTYPNVKDEGGLVEPSVTEFNFTGVGVTAISSGSRTVEVNVPGGGSTDMENSGSGIPLIQNPGTGPTVYTKSLIAGSGMTIIDNGSDITMISTGGSSPTDVENAGAGFTPLVQNPGSNPVYIKNLYSSDGSVSYGDNGSYLDLRATGLVGPQGPAGPTGPQGNPGAVNDVENSGSGTPTVQNPGSNSTIYMKGMNAGSNMTITDYGSYLQFDASGSGGSYPTIYQNGSSYGTQSGLNFTGNVSINYSGYGVDINVTSNPPTIYNNGSSYGNPSGINFTGGCAVSSSGYGVDVYVTPGPQGPQGDPGPTGPTGPPGAVNDVENTGSGTPTVQNPGSNATIYMKGIQAGANMTVTDNGSYITLDSASPSYPTIYDEGSSLGTQAGINFVGAGVTASASGFGVDVTIPGSSGITDLTGDVTATGPGSSVATIANNAVTTIKINNSAVTTAKINNSAVTYAKLQNESAATLLGNSTAGLAAPSEIPLNSTLSFATGSLQRSALTGDVTASAGSNATTIANNAVTVAKFQQGGANTVLANPTGSTANFQALALAASTLLGRDTGNLTGITVGTGLQLLSGVLSSTVTGGASTWKLVNLTGPSGTYTPTAGTKFILVIATGGGGGSGGIKSGVSGSGATGGGAGAYTSLGFLNIATVGASQTYTIGNGGTSGVGATPTAGGTGSTTTFGTGVATVSAIGGTGSSGTTCSSSFVALPGGKPQTSFSATSTVIFFWGNAGGYGQSFGLNGGSTPGLGGDAPLWGGSSSNLSVAQKGVGAPGVATDTNSTVDGISGNIGAISIVEFI